MRNAPPRVQVLRCLFQKKTRGRQHCSCSRNQRKGPYAAALSGSLELGVLDSPVSPLGPSPLESAPSPALALEKGSVRQGQELLRREIYPLRFESLISLRGSVVLPSLPTHHRSAIGYIMEWGIFRYVPACLRGRSCILGCIRHD